MKRIKLYMIMLAVTTAGFTLTSCDDDFMNEIPQTDMSVPGYFNTVADLETYANGLYTQISWISNKDADSDNVVGMGHGDGNELWSVLFGGTSKDNIGYSIWEDHWKDIFSVNVLLDNADRAQGNKTDIDHWKAFGHYCRAFHYIKMVQRYSSVPWIEHAITSSDPDVYRASDPRTFVVDKIMKDLEYACEFLKPTIGNRTRINKYCALALMSRFALYEGTFRKYHSELNLQSTADEFGYTVNKFLERVVSASLAIMNSGQFEVSATPSVDNIVTGIADIKGSPTYRALFASRNLGSNKEIIRWVEYNTNVGQGASINPTHYSLSRSLMESYLTNEGKPFSTVAGYPEIPYYEGFANRDPRLVENIAHPGSIVRQTPSPLLYTLYLARGGYTQEKFEANRQDAYYYEGRPLYRYAETLLNYAEAQAELGSFDSDPKAKECINMLRKRVGMPDIDVNREVDQMLRDQYPGVNDLIRVIRRERRVELACEGFRLQDINRWGVGEIFLRPEARQGIYIPKLGTYDYDGDGIDDMAIYRKDSDIPTDWLSRPNITIWYYLEPRTLPDSQQRGNYAEFIELEGTDKGFVRGKEEGRVRTFRSPKDYYRPINVQHTSLNPGIKQPPGWE